MVLQKKEQLATYDPIAVGLFFVVAAATHPLTGLFGGVILAILGAIVLVSCARERRLWFLAFFSITALLSLLALSPWLYMLHQFGNKIPINSPAWKVVSFRSEGFFPHSIDNILSRLSLFPLDLRAIQNGVQGVSGPYLDAQITMPLILFLACFIYIGIREKLIRRSFNRCEWSMMVGALLMLLITFTLSICPEISGWFGGFFDILQFPYRLATFVNLSALILLIPIAGRISRVQVNSRQIINICLAVCIAVSFSALILKLIHASVVMSRSTEKKGWVMDKLQDGMLWAPNPGGSSRHLNEMPGTFTAGGVYFVEDGFSTVVSAGAIPVIRGDFNVLDQDRIGDVEPLVVNLPQLTLVITNVQPFPWNHIFVDGSAQQPSRRLLAAGRQSVLLPPGRHRLDFVASIDGTWKALDVLSWLLLTGWMALCLRWAFVKKNFVDVDPGGRDAAV